MSIRTNITDYAHGEALVIEATLTDDGVALTTGTVELRLGLTSNGAPALTLAGSHSAGGVWAFSATAAQMAFAVEGQAIYYDVWETGADRRYAYGTISVARSITS